MDDEVLLAAIANDDETALRVLFERHAPWLAARLRRALPASAVEDVLQETFIAVWRNARKHDGRGAVGAWLWGIARRQGVTWLRKYGRPSSGLDWELAGSEDTSAVASDRVDLQRALAALDDAGASQRELAQLALEEERPIVEVAALLGVPEGTVKSRLHRVRRLLRAALGGGRTG